MCYVKAGDIVSARMHNNVELARVAADALMKLEPEKSSTPYVLLYIVCLLTLDDGTKHQKKLTSTAIGMLVRIANSSNEASFYELQKHNPLIVLFKLSYFENIETILMT
ncbi:hypothetical protein Ddye_004221 [Dipteronia dyeriana]|uniref:Uncharacterized protein n=1 Tax=Dipteronia dyeriana TaxID=168575 RepID=A0AAD9XUB4_9ROSI|nr:hypothetical protein Ddye_004221 [Dipteronia dyeriana]